MRAWTVSEVKAGTLTQCLGVARHFDAEPHSVIVKQKLRFWQVGPLSPHRAHPSPEPGLILSCGSMAPRHVFAIAGACRSRPFTVHLQTPQPEFADRYDMAFISRHDWTDAKARHGNFHQMLGVPHQITTAALHALRASARAKWLPAGGKAVSVLVGGSNGAYLFDDATIDRLIAAIEGFARDGWTALVSTSRRSNPQILERLLGLSNERIRVWDRTGDNPYREFLAAADALLVTKDSVTMACEAVTTGQPAYVFDLAKGEPSDKLAKFEWFHDDLSRTLGLTRRFEGRLDPYAYTPPDEARRIAELVEATMAERGAGKGLRAHG